MDSKGFVEGFMEAASPVLGVYISCAQAQKQPFLLSMAHTIHMLRVRDMIVRQQISHSHKESLQPDLVSAADSLWSHCFFVKRQYTLWTLVT